MSEAFAPWLTRALQLLDLRRKDRLLLVLPGDVRLARAVARVVGPDGALTVLEPHRRVAEAIADALPQADVLALLPESDETFGSFDAVLAAPFTAPPLPVAAWAGVAANLRPGGRFAFDLPAPASLPDVVEAVRTAQLPSHERIVEALAGPEQEALVAALQARGLRRVETMLGTHLLSFDSPFDLADQVAATARLEEEERLALGEAIARRLHSTAECETLAHRSAVAGMR